MIIFTYNLNLSRAKLGLNVYANAIKKNTMLHNCLTSSCLHQQPIKPNWRQSNLAYKVITSASVHSPPSITVSASAQYIEDIHQTTVSIFTVYVRTSRKHLYRANRVLSEFQHPIDLRPLCYLSGGSFEETNMLLALRGVRFPIR